MFRLSARFVPALILLAAGAALPFPTAASGETYTCVCLDGCGNGGLSASAGTVRTGQQEGTLQDWYGLDGPGESSRTGWTCVVETLYDCRCSEGCGNGAPHGSRGELQRDVSALDAVQRYGAWKSGHRATGWACAVAGEESGSPSRQDLRGSWRDRDGNRIDIRQDRDRVELVRQADSGSAAPQVAEGRIQADRLIVNAGSGWSEVRGRVARLGAVDRIEWTHGPVWTRWTDGPIPGREVSVLVTCSSEKKLRRTCSVPGWVLTASVARRHSKSGCDEGRDWGWSGSELWVDNGCRADFEVVHDDSGARERDSGQPEERRPRSAGELLLGAILESAGVEVFDDPDESAPSGSSDDDEPAAADARGLTGAWEDGYGSRIDVTQDGERVRARMLSERGRRWWTHAEGSLGEGGLTLEQTRNGRDVGRRHGRLVEANEIEWDDGQVWRRISVEPWPEDEAEPLSRADLTGDWRDGHGRVLSLVQEGWKVRAQMLDADGKRWWTDGEGRLEGDELQLSYFRRGRSVDEQTGRLVGEDRIDWPDGSSWTRLSQGSTEPERSSRVDLGGDWHDSYGEDIRVEQEGRRLRATMLGTSGQRWWSTGQGRVEQGRVEMELFRRGRSVDDLTGRVIDEDRIEWDNGAVWRRGHRHGSGR